MCGDRNTDTTDRYIDTSFKDETDAPASQLLPDNKLIPCQTLCESGVVVYTENGIDSTRSTYILL
jgi:hypothetical protein